MDNTTPQPEKAPESSEQPLAPEVTPQPAAPVQPAPTPAPAPMPDLSRVDVPQQPSQTSVPSTPQIADDVDVIEKEWVDKAKQIVASTKDDPHLREQEVAKLQADYLRKRYGKELGSPQ